jgi:hypothetical protein
MKPVLAAKDACFASRDVAFRKDCAGAALRRDGWRTAFIAA